MSLPHTQLRNIQAPLITALLFCIPTISRAATLKSIAATVVDILNNVVNFIMVIALLAFMVGVIRFMYSVGDTKSRDDGKQVMIWGIIAFAVMVSVWGLVKIIKVTLFG